MILTTNNITRPFGGIIAVNNVNLSINEGEISSIIGPNGAGKTTLFNILTGHIKLETGKVIFKGQDITNMAPHKICRKGVGRSFQRTIAFPRLSVFENIRTSLLASSGRTLNFFNNASKMFNNNVEEIVESIGLGDSMHKLASELAHGDQKRLDMGIAIACNPKLVLLDEPTAGMSPEESVKIMSLVTDLAKNRKLTIIFVEHDMKIVFDYSQIIRVMHQGKIIAEGKPEDVRRNLDVQRVYFGEDKI